MLKKLSNAFKNKAFFYEQISLLHLPKTFIYIKNLLFKKGKIPAINFGSIMSV